MSTGFQPRDTAYSPPGERGAAAPGVGSEEDDRLRAENEDLRQALETRPVIDQARGMVMALGECSPEQAWNALVQISQHTNIKLRTVAADLVATTTGQPLPDPIREALRQALQGLRNSST